jgi:MFS family permease
MGAVVTGALGIVLSIVIFFGVRDTPRGSSEPEMEAVEQPANYRFNWKTAKNLIKIPSLRLLVAQGFFGVFPWNVIIYWFFRYLEVERGYSDSEILVTMGTAVLILATGYPLGGALGDWLFKRTPRGRIIVATTGVLTGAILFFITMNVPTDNRLLFGIMMSLTAIFIPFASPNVVSILYDITLPEVRATASGLESFCENIGAALTPLIAGIIGDMFSLHDAILWICLSAWLVCTVFFLLIGRTIPADIQRLRDEMKSRAAQEGLSTNLG